MLETEHRLQATVTVRDDGVDGVTMDRIQCSLGSVQAWWNAKMLMANTCAFSDLNHTSHIPIVWRYESSSVIVGMPCRT